MTVQHYADLIAWQKAMDLTDAVYDATEPFPTREVFGLAQQMRKAAVSIPSNIAEGQARSTTKDFVHFLTISRGSLQELETQVLISHRRKLISDETKSKLVSTTSETSRIISGLIRSLATRQ